MTTDLGLGMILAFGVLSAFVMFHSDELAKWISKNLARVASLKRTAGPQGSTAATDRKSVLPFVRSDRSGRHQQRVDAEYAPRLTALRIVQQVPVIRGKR
jgi:hypothetical protein